MAQKTWIATAGGNWTTAANWTGGLPGISDDALIQSGAVAPYTLLLNSNVTTNSVTLNDAQATLDITPAGLVGLTTGTFDLVAGTLRIDSTASLANATILMDGGATNFQNGLLSNVTIRGATTIGSGNNLHFANHIGFSSLNGIGRGSLTLVGGTSHMYADDNETLTNVDLTFGNGAQLGESGGGTLTLASDMTLTC